MNGFLPLILVQNSGVCDRFGDLPAASSPMVSSAPGGETGEVPQSEDSDWHRP